MTTPSSFVAALCEQLRQFREYRLKWYQEIRRLAPLCRLLGAARGDHLADDRRHYCSSVLPTDHVQALKRLVDEVKRVPVIGERPVSLGGEQQVGELGWRCPAGDGSEQCPLGALAVTHDGPLPQPAFELGQVWGSVKWGARAPGRLTGAVGRYAPSTMEKCEIYLVIGQMRQKIPERGEDGEPDAPAVAVAGAEQRHLLYNLCRSDTGGKETLHRLGDNQPKIVCHAVLEPSAPVRGGVGEVERWPDPDLAGPQLDGTSRHVVGPKVERAAARKIEPGVVPVARKHAILDGPTVKRKAHMRTAIVQREHLTPVEDHQNRPVAPA